MNARLSRPHLPIIVVLHLCLFSLPGLPVQLLHDAAVVAHLFGLLDITYLNAVSRMLAVAVPFCQRPAATLMTLDKVADTSRIAVSAFFTDECDAVAVAHLELSLVSRLVRSRVDPGVLATYSLVVLCGSIPDSALCTQTQPFLFPRLLQRGQSI